MNETIYLKKLEQREIKPTAIRLLILKTMMQHKEAFSLLDLENEQTWVLDCQLWEFFRSKTNFLCFSSE